MRKEINRLLDLGVIEVGQSDYASPMILVESPGKDPRPCVDYRTLNAKTRTEFFRFEMEVVEKVSAASYITIMDLTKGYFQIPLTKNAQRYAAFVTPFGTFIPKVMMFGLLNAPFYFCKLIAGVLQGTEIFALPYVDDIEHPIVYLSKKFSPAEKNYSTIERELDAIIYGLKKIESLFGRAEVYYSDGS